MTLRNSSVRLIVEKQKEAEQGEPISLELTPISATSPRGDVLRSCILTPTSSDDGDGLSDLDLSDALPEKPARRRPKADGVMEELLRLDAGTSFSKPEFVQFCRQQKVGKSTAYELWPICAKHSGWRLEGDRLVRVGAD